MGTGTKKLPVSEILVRIYEVISWSTPQTLHQAINLVIIQVMKRQSTIKFLGILLDENLSEKKHLTLTEKKVAKNIAQHTKRYPI